MAFLVKALFRWNKCSENDDIKLLSNFLAIFFKFFSQYREILPNFIYMPNFRSIGPFKQKLQRLVRISLSPPPPPPPPAIPICKKPGLFRVNYALLEEILSEIKIVQVFQKYFDIVNLCAKWPKFVPFLAV